MPLLLVLVALLSTGCWVVDAPRRGWGPPPFSDEEISLTLLRDLSTLAPPDLQAVDAACSADPDSPITLTCNAHIEGRCLADEFLTGFGVRNVDEQPYTCVTSAAAEHHTVSFASALSECDIDPGCAGDPACEAVLSMACISAIDQYCNALGSGFASGFGPIARSASDVTVMCTRSKATELELVPVATVAPDSSCDSLASTGTVPQACALQIGSFCALAPGIEGGFGPLALPNGSDEIPIACLRASERFERNPDWPQSPALEADAVPIDLLRDESEVLILDNGGLPQYREAHSRHSRLEALRNTSNDGRLYATQDPLRDVGEVGTSVWLGLMLPEKLTQPLAALLDPAVGGIRASSERADLFILDVDALYSTPGSTPSKVVHLSVCDAGSQLGAPNPRPCDASFVSTGTAADVYDCYELTILNIFNASSELWGTPLSIRVEDPKTVQARVVDVSYGMPQQSPASVEIFEPSVTEDGRLLVIHGIGLGNQGLRYSYIAPPGSPAEADPNWPWLSGSACDVSKWESFVPLSSMYTDPYLDAYPVARFPFRDSENKTYTAGEQIGGSYPWVDRAGANIAFAQGSGTLAYKLDEADQNVLTRYPLADGSDPLAGGDASRRLGRSIMGLWTQGKTVAFDNRLNLADFGFEYPENHHALELYRDDLQLPVDVEVGGTIAHLIGSPESQLSYLPMLRNLKPRDVVWPISAGTTNVTVTEEVAFDDFLLPTSFILSSMNASINNATITINDGFEWLQPAGSGAVNIGLGFTQPAHIANAATAISPEVAELSRFVGPESAMWEVPPFGKLLGGARVEPVAAGGIEGKGLWLDGVDDRLEYQIKGPKDLAGTERFALGPWFYSLSLDARRLALSSEERLFTGPDSSYINLAVNALGAQSLRFGKSGESFAVAIPTGLELVAREWGQLAVLSEPNGGGGYRISIYWQGFLLHREESPATDFFRMRTGLLTLGWEPNSSDMPFQGWVDELKVIAERPGPEEICNHAQGSLVSVFDTSGREASLYQLASLFDTGNPGPGLGWVELDALLGAQAGEKFVCERALPLPSGGEDYLCYGKLHTPGWNPHHASCLRLALTGGQIYADAPRPDSTNNAFCTSCHTDLAATASLDIASALSPGGVNMPDDPRRQPFQHEAALYGRIPAGHLPAGPHAASAGLPASSWPPVDISAGSPYSEGEPIDGYTTPAAP